jgi:PAS domain S-box-containing protein
VLKAGVPEVETWLKQLWENTSDAMALSDRDGIVVAANPAYYELYGYGPRDVLGKSFALIFPFDQRAWAEEQYQEIVRSSVPPPVMQARVTRQSGDERIVESRASFIEERGQRTAMLSIVRDVPEEVAARRAAARAEHNLRAVVFSLSHDIKSPLAIIKGHAQVVRRLMLRQSALPPLERSAAWRTSRRVRSRRRPRR